MSYNRRSGVTHGKVMTNSTASATSAVILAGAQADAAGVYRDLSPYQIGLVLEDDGWHMDYELKAPRLKGAEKGDIQGIP